MHFIEAMPSDELAWKPCEWEDGEPMAYADMSGAVSMIAELLDIDPSVGYRVVTKEY